MKYFKTNFIFSYPDASSLDKETLIIAQELCPAIVGELGYESFEDTENGVIGYIQQQMYNNGALNETLSNFPLPEIAVKFTTETVEDKNWNEVWEKNGYLPITIGDKCIIHDPEHHPEKQFNIDIVIDAHQAFGTGTHETTQMIVGELLEMNLVGKNILDCGCGTGILSIAAAKLGARTATGYDVDEWSVRNTEHNARLNSQNNIRVFLGDASLLTSNIFESFDLAMANINRNILLNDMSKICGRIKHGGFLIISGFYATDVDTLKDKANDLGLILIGRRESDEWNMLKFKKMLKPRVVIVNDD